MRCVIRVWEMMKRGSVDQLRSLEENERKCEVCVCVCVCVCVWLVVGIFANCSCGALFMSVFQGLHGAVYTDVCSCVCVCVSAHQRLFVCSVWSCVCFCPSE